MVLTTFIISDTKGHMVWPMQTDTSVHNAHSRVPRPATWRGTSNATKAINRMRARTVHLQVGVWYDHSTYRKCLFFILCYDKVLFPTSK